MRLIKIGVSQQQRNLNSPQMILDKYPTTGFAYSYSRELLSGQGKIIRAKRQDLIPDELFSVKELYDGTLENWAAGQEVRMNKWDSVQGWVYPSVFVEITLFHSCLPVLAFNGIIQKVNNIACIDLTPASKRLSSDSTSNAFTEGNFTWYHVFQTQSSASIQVPITECQLTTNYNGNGIVSSTTNDTVAIFRPQSTNHVISNSTNYPRPQLSTNIVTMRRTGNLIEAFLNKTKMGDMTVTQLFLNQTGLRFGTWGGSQNAFRGRFFETIMYPESQSDTIMNSIIDNQMAYYL